jgi:ABC transporter substrate binding protein
MQFPRQLEGGPLTDGPISSPKCDTLLIPDVVLGAGEAMRRRDFIILLGGAAATRPLAVRAQQRALPMIGFLSSAAPGPFKQFVEAFQRGLNEKGFIEGQNATIEYRWAEGHFDRLPALATDLVQHNVAVIAASGGPPSALAAKAATSTIPIVFNVASDPIKLGLVASLNHPGGNATGVNLFSVAVEPKKLELLHELVPKAEIIGVFVNPHNTNAETIIGEVETAARALQLQINVVKISAADEFGLAFCLSCPTSDWCASRCSRSVLQRATRSARSARRTIFDSRDIRIPRIRRGGRFDELRD